MSENGEEEEIKIEYFESFDTDPLCENSGKPTCVTSDSATLNICDENINQRSRLQWCNIKEFWHSSKQTSSPLSYASAEKKTKQFAFRRENKHSNSNGVNWLGNTGVNDENEYPMIKEYEETWYKSVDDLGRYHCKFCENSYSTIQTVRHHVKNKHIDDYKRIIDTVKNKLRRRKLKCHICKKRFKNIDLLQVHIQTHGINNIQKSCFVCQATFGEENEKLTHISKHECVKKKHFCITCGYSTSKLSHFKQHEKTHSRYNQIKCSYCEYTTYHPPNMKIHKRTHTNDKPYTCTFNGCDYRCAAKSGLSSHLLRHEKEKNMIYCDKCSYSTVYKQSLKKHMDSHRRNSVRTSF